MSEGTSESASNIETVDVDEIAKENGTLSEKSSDSGIETTETCSYNFQASSDSETSPVKSISNYEIDLVLDCDNVCKETKKDEDSKNSEGFLCSIGTNNALEGQTSEILTPDMAPDQSIADIHTKSLENINANETKILEVIKSSNKNIASSKSSENSQILYSDLTTSCVSLNTQIPSQNITNDLTLSCTSLENEIYRQKITKSFSRSAENIPSIIQNDSALTTSNNNLNKDEILNQFMLQKKQANATQRIPENQIIDNKYRIPKEILSQDLGNIVKNVHGMFSSVSGSLKYYTHRTGQKPVKSIKAVNSKVMTDIFEDENIEIGQEDPDVKESIDHQKETGDVKEEANPKSEVLRLQIESLEKLLFEQRRDNGILKDRIKEQVDELHEKDQKYKEIEVKMDLITKRADQVEREKDAAVMRYASVECAAIEAKRAADTSQRAERAARAEMELMCGKVKSAHSEKQRIIQLYDDKCHELQNSERELAKVRDDIKELEGRLKWTQTKLRMEMDAYKESNDRAEKLSQQVSEVEAARDAAAANATDSIKTKQLESELKEARAALILCRHENEELDRRLSSNIQQLDTCKKERDAASSRLAHSLTEIEELKISNMRLEEEAAELAALRAKAALADTLSSQLERETDRANQAEEALALERAEAETCARREASALAHAARLTARHVAAQASDHDTIHKAQALSADNACLRERISSLEAECVRLRSSLSEEAERRNLENRVLARKVAELTEEVADACKKLEWEKGENVVLKKKHASAIKELNRELQRTLKRCEQLEAKLPPPEAPSTRTGSVTSLSSCDSAPQEERLHNGHSEPSAEIQVREPDRQALIERIVSLQRAAARRAERCEFLEEHSRQLTEELRNKARLLRQLLCSLPTGAVTSPHRDLNKKQIASLGGGAMAALWGGDPAGMTLELSLEMNKRLQAVLEDTLLKNITLKDNMDTLGAEISRLKGQKPDQ